MLQAQVVVAPDRWDKADDNFITAQKLLKVLCKEEYVDTLQWKRNQEFQCLSRWGPKNSTEAGPYISLFVQVRCHTTFHTHIYQLNTSLSYQELFKHQRILDD